jgi:hypothetical protein
MYVPHVLIVEDDREIAGLVARRCPPRRLLGEAVVDRNVSTTAEGALA